jgi:hypothetical protein
MPRGAGYRAWDSTVLPRNRKNADGVRRFRAAGIVWKKELAFRACVIEITPNFE